MSPIAANLQAVRRRIFEALQGDTREVTLVGVTKSQPPSSIREAHAAGCRHFGESYVQEVTAKMEQLGDLDIHHTTRLRLEHFLQHPGTPHLG